MDQECTQRRRDAQDAALALLLLALTTGFGMFLRVVSPDPPLDCAHLTDLARLYAPTYADHRNAEACQQKQP